MPVWRDSWALRMLRLTRPMTGSHVMPACSPLSAFYGPRSKRTPKQSPGYKKPSQTLCGKFVATAAGENPKVWSCWRWPCSNTRCSKWLTVNCWWRCTGTWPVRSPATNSNCSTKADRAAHRERSITAKHADCIRDGGVVQG